MRATAAFVVILLLVGWSIAPSARADREPGKATAPATKPAAPSPDQWAGEYHRLGGWHAKDDESSRVVLLKVGDTYRLRNTHYDEYDFVEEKPGLLWDRRHVLGTITRGTLTFEAPSRVGLRGPVTGARGPVLLRILLPLRRRRGGSDGPNARDAAGQMTTARGPRAILRDTRMTPQPAEVQLTSAPHGHILTNINVWSPDGRWIVYDTRSDAAGAAFDGTRIERVNVETREVQVLYESRNGATLRRRHLQPGRWAGRVHPRPRAPDADWTYAASRRQGVIVDPARPGSRATSTPAT